MNLEKYDFISQEKGFLGLASYYRKFIKDFSKIAKPLTKLMEGIKRNKKVNKNGKPLESWEKSKKTSEAKKKISDRNFIEKWGNEQEKAFEILKEKLTMAPVLMYPDFEKEFTLYTDASGFALGAVLAQVGKDKKEHVIAYASRSLTKAEQNYTVTEQECLAIIWAVDKFHHYLISKKFKIITDHIALKWLFNKEPKKGRLARWQLKLQMYDFTVIYKEGKKHKNADALSRIKNE